MKRYDCYQTDLYVPQENNRALIAFLDRTTVSRWSRKSSKFPTAMATADGTDLVNVYTVPLHQEGNLVRCWVTPRSTVTKDRNDPCLA